MATASLRLGRRTLSAAELDTVVQPMRLTQIVPYTPAASDGDDPSILVSAKGRSQTYIAQNTEYAAGAILVAGEVAVLSAMHDLAHP